jgi:hypothetical protein
MQAVFALTLLAKSHKCDKYVQHSLRMWYLYELIEKCNTGHMKQMAIVDECARCIWLLRPDTRGRPPTFAVRKILKEWYK